MGSDADNNLDEAKVETTLKTRLQKGGNLTGEIE